MLERLQRFIRTEPARFYLIVRTLAYLLLSGLATQYGVDLEMVLTTLALVLGLDATTTERGVRSKVYQPERVSQLVTGAAELGAGSNVWASEVGRWVASFLRGQVSSVKLPFALQALTPLVRQFANAQLTPELRAELQGKIHQTLRDLNLIKRVSIPARGIVFLVLLLVAGCLPTQDFVAGGLNELTADGSSLVYTVDGALFDAGPEDALRAFADVRGEDLVFYDAEDNCMELVEFWRCERELVEAGDPWLIDLSGDDLSMTVTFERDDGDKHQALPE